MLSSQLDPNWYYSSLAQASAGVVGLFGAIVTTRLQATLEQAVEQQLRTSEALRELGESAQPMFDRFSRYAENGPSQVERMKAAILRGGTSMSEVLWFSPYDTGVNGVEVGIDSHGLAVETARTALAIAIVPRRQGLLAATNRETLYRFGPTVELLLSEEAEGMPQQLRALSKLAHEAAKQLALLSIRTQSRIYVVLLTFLTILSTGGLIAPLCFLTAYDRSHKFILTGTLAAGLGVLLCYIAWQVIRLRALGSYDSLLPPRPKAEAAA